MHILPCNCTVVLTDNENEGFFADGMQYVRILGEMAVKTSPLTGLGFTS